jgi:hypothetical protein
MSSQATGQRPGEPQPRRDTPPLCDRDTPVVPSRMRFAGLLVLGLVGILGCSHPSKQTCDKGCRNYFSIRYWQEAEKEIAAAPEADRERLRAEKTADLEDRLLQGLELCVSQCEKAAKPAEGKCMAEAKTVADLEKCGVTFKK